MKKFKNSVSESKGAVRTAHITIDSPKIREVVKDVFQTKYDFEIKYEEVQIIVLEKSVVVIGSEKNDFKWKASKEITVPDEKTLQVIKSALKIKIDFENLFEETRVVLFKNAVVVLGANNNKAIEEKIGELLSEEQI